MSGQGGGRDINTREDAKDEDETTNTNVVHTPIDTEGTNIVRNLKFESFRAKLITNFNIQYQKKVLVRPVAQEGSYI